MTAIAAIALAAALASAAPAAKVNGWDVLYTVADRSIAFNTIYATGKHAWVGGGPGVLVVQADGVTQPHRVDLDVSYIAGTRLGAYAVGSRGSVWSIRGATLQEEHRLTGPRKVRDPMTLDWLEPWTLGGKQGVLAFGVELMLFGAGDGKWSVVAESEAAPLRRTLIFDRGVDLEGCGPKTWIPLRDGADTGFLSCGDRRTFIGNASLQSRPRLPRDCPRPYSAATGGDGRMAVLCDYRKSWLLFETSDGWIKKPAPMGIVQIHSAGSCLFAATARSIWRTCDPTAPAPASR